ncbi:acetoacetate decarboxylase family protein [Caenimonas sp. SL110]|uniref:acetoacetate decarboxylase family protein n=1 Tax=Caenimonas sp. SL110 TaxID=1450524 RepID=UPI000653D57D|nr:acetoacetate decarboxylase family protein [Caenimonas sp. SL110]
MAFFDSAPFALPERSPLFKPAPRFYKGYRKLGILCEGSLEGIQKALPADFEAMSNIFEVFVMNSPEVHDVSRPEMGPRSYLEGGIVVPVRYGDLVGGHVLYEFVTTDDSLASGREVWGYPKKMADVTFSEEGSGAITATVSRLGRTLIDARFTPGDNSFDKPQLNPRIQRKRIPRADGTGYDVDQIIRNELRAPKVHSMVRGTATVNLGGSPLMDPLFELDIQRVIGAEFLIAEFFLDWGTVHRDLLAT